MATLEQLLAEKARRQAAKPSLEVLQAEARKRGLASGEVQPEPTPEPVLDTSVPEADKTLLESASDVVGDAVELVTGSKRTSELPRSVQDLPELGGVTTAVSTGDTGADIQIAAGLLSSFETPVLKDIIKDAVPDVEFVDFDGTTVVKLPNGKQAILNAPGLSQQDALTSVGQVLSFIPATKLAGLGKTIAQKMAIGGAASGATDLSLQGVTQALGSEQDVNLGQAATTAALGVGAELFGPAITAVKKLRESRRATKQIEGDTLVREGQEAQEATGIDLFPAQLTQDASQLERQAFVGSLPAGTERSTKALRLQNEQAADAAENVMSMISPARSIDNAAKRFRTAAEDSILAKKKIRNEAASPFYTQAKRENAEVNTGSVIGMIDSKLVNLAESSASAKQLRKVRDLIEGSSDITKEKAVNPDFFSKIGQKTAAVKRIPRVRKLHETKLEIDQMLEAFGDNSLGRTTKGHVREIKDQLLLEMDNASDAYKQARQTFADNSPAVNALEDSVIGTIAGLDDKQLKTASAKIFDSAETNPTVIKDARKAIQDVDPQAWNDLLRVELERRMGSMKASLDEAGGTVENVPGQLNRAIFGNVKQRRVLFNAVDQGSEEGKNLRFLHRALQRAEQGRGTGSQTATRKEIIAELKGGAWQGIRNFVRKPFSEAVTIGEDAQFNRRVASLADSLFDKEWVPEFTRIRKMDQSSPDTAKAMLQLLNDIEGTQTDGSEK